jgi:4-hydroxy-3-methylbut-2-enyl diphosphate reductase
VAAYLIDGADDIKNEWLQSAAAVGVTAGASAPEVLVQEVVDKLQREFDASVIQNDGHTENVSFQLPRELR